jgi:predicted dinucleotide-binding enzyme
MRQLATFLFLIANFSLASADTIAIIGTGDVARALGPEFAAQGHTIVYGSRNPSENRVTELVGQDHHRSHQPDNAVETSNAEIIQAAAPGAYVVKAFNSLNWKTMIDPDSSGGPVSILMVGDSDSAKKTVAALVEGMGLEAIDLGGIKNAHWVEGMLILWLNNRYGPRESFDYYLRKTK